MESTKTIKGLDEETWSKFKSLAAENNLKMPEMFKAMMDEWNKSADFWNNILSTEKILSEKEADVLLSTTKKLRSERGYR